MSPIKTIMSVLKALTDIITNIPARSIGLAEILVIMSISTFKIAVILYVLNIVRISTPKVPVTAGKYSSHH
jgi:hypothetical protein